MAEEETESEETPAKSGPMKKIILGVVALALIGGVVVGGMTFFGADEDEAADDATAAAEAEPTSGPALYTSLHPPLVINFKDSVGDSHFMQITMEVMTRDQEVANAVREHTPVIRNALILLYGGVVYEEVTTRDGKEEMLADGLREIQNVMTAEIGEPGVEAVYFTALVIQ